MTDTTATAAAQAEPQQALEQARRLAATGQALQAEMVLLALLQQDPACGEAAFELARLALARGDDARARQRLAQACDADPAQLGWAADLAFAYLSNREPGRAGQLLEQRHAAGHSSPTTWLLLGHAREATGDAHGAWRAWDQALHRAHSAGLWRSPATTPAHLVGAVAEAMRKAHAGRREILRAVLDAQRQRFGAAALKRVEHALAGYLGAFDATPPDPRQRPKFFYFPELPSPPYHDPYLQPWARTLQAHWREMRAEVEALFAEPSRFQGFLDFKPGQKTDDYVGGNGPAPAWDAFFFYRHGQRYDDNHARCPLTSGLLDSIELCRVADQAPEVCFSVLAPGSHIKAHYGVTNTRLVFHLPLIVPPGCALNVIDGGEHRWREGEPMMFDDTFQHEAWNRSDRTRVILLMDCWNPHLAPEEREAVKALVEAISAFERG